MRGFAVLILLLFSAALAEGLRAQAARPGLQPVTRFGCVDCNGAELFTSVQDIAVDNEGRIFILDSEAPMLRVFDRSGATLLASGRRGRGPGEFQLGTHVGIRRDGSFQVLDARLQRLTRFDRAGNVLETITIAGFPLAAAYSGADHVLFLATTDFSAPTATVVALEDTSSAVRTVLQLQVDFPRQRDGQPTLFFDLIAAAGGGFAIGAGTLEYHIRRYDRSGQPVSDIIRNIPRVRRTAQEIQLERERRERTRERAARMRQAESGGRAGPGGDPTMPPEKNHFNAHALAFDEHGRLWVRTERGGPARTIFDLFAASGEYVGELSLPVDVHRFALNAGIFAAVVSGEDDVAQVAVWRVTP